MLPCFHVTWTGFYKRRCQEETLLLKQILDIARHRALVGICMLPVRAWVETLIPDVVLHRDLLWSDPETTQAAWVVWQPWFYLRLNGL